MVVSQGDTSLASEIAGAVAPLSGDSNLTDKGADVGALASAKNILRAARWGQGILEVIESDTACAGLACGIVVGA